ncbi:Acetate operon repressor [Dermatophilus congolensis]|uniref:Acetate operon repressor n=1 Tax=Dermatophilus congolensis TaxID=1863 RepID=A0AA46BQC9_9MICO|nr:IclR family transcriptional regulator [Dermatophilus congolensis]STD15527.1 Acetate operon repressor [Dermatophilus congolensis]
MAQVPAAMSALRILRYLGTRRGPVSAASIATALSLPRSSVYHLLAALIETGFVVHLETEHLYGIGPAAAELGTAYSRQVPIARIATPALDALVERIGESAHLSVLLGQNVVYVSEVRAPRRPMLVSETGVRLPAHLTASGRAILAALPAKQIRALYPDAAAFPHSSADKTSWSPGRLRTTLQKVRARGWAVERGEITAGMSSVAVAIHDHLGWPCAALAFTVEDERLPTEREPVLINALRAVANKLENTLCAENSPRAHPSA